MTQLPTDSEMRLVVERIDALVRHLESVDPGAGREARELVRLVMQLYGAGLTRIMGMLQLQEPRTGPVLATLLTDDLVASLLVLHDLHPDDPATRVRRALARLECDVGARFTLVDLTPAAACVRVEVVVPSALDLRRLVDEVIRAAVPAIERVDIEGLPPVITAGLVQLQRGRVGAAPITAAQQ